VYAFNGWARRRYWRLLPPFAVGEEHDFLGLGSI